MKSRKSDFPIFTQTINGHPLTYLDSAATSQKPKIVIDAISNFYKTANANVKRAIYPLADNATIHVEKVREDVAGFINAQSKDEIIFVRNTTEALNLVAYSMSSILSKKDSVATTILEHHSNFVPWQILAARTGSWFEVIDFDESSNFILPDFKNIKILALSHVSNVLGNIIDVKTIIRKARKDNPDIIVIIDAAQSVPHMKVDVRDFDCDFLAFSGHKMFAGMGVGVLYGKKKRLDMLDPFLFGGQMIEEVSVEKTTFRKIPDKFEAGTLSAADIFSLGKAIEYIDSIGMQNIETYERKLTEYASEKIKSVSNLKVIGESEKRRIGVIAFTIEGIHPHDIAQILGDRGICLRAGHHCCMPLHKRLGIDASTRLSLSIYNDTKDIDRLVEGLEEVKRILNR